MSSGLDAKWCKMYCQLFSILNISPTFYFSRNVLYLVALVNFLFLTFKFRVTLKCHFEKLSALIIDNVEISHNFHLNPTEVDVFTGIRLVSHPLEAGLSCLILILQFCNLYLKDI